MFLFSILFFFPAPLKHLLYTVIHKVNEVEKTLIYIQNSRWSTADHAVFNQSHIMISIRKEWLKQHMK